MERSIINNRPKNGVRITETRRRTWVEDLVIRCRLWKWNWGGHIGRLGIDGQTSLQNGYHRMEWEGERFFFIKRKNWKIEEGMYKEKL